MIIDFKFKNYLSFAEECNFTMLASKDKSHEDNLIVVGKERYSKTRIVYGANASGKSSFIKAMLFISTFVANSNRMLEKMPIKVMPFKFCDDCFNNPTECAITFLKDGIKYAYKFSCTREKVIDERLDVYYSAKPTMIFNRTNSVDYEFNRDSKLLNELKERNLENKLFLVTSAAWNYAKTKPVVDYLLNTISVVLAGDMDVAWRDNLDRIYANNELEQYKAFCLKILNNADLSISDFSLDFRKVGELSKKNKDLAEFIHFAARGDADAVDRLEDTNLYELITFHDINDGEKKSRYSLKLAEESLGTTYMFKYSPLLYYVFKEGKVLFIDEIDKSLHPLMVEYLVKMFLDKNINTGNAQLIANTHDTNLLNLDIFRRDDIWFAERDYESGKTEIYSLADFSPRTSENIENAYLLGRFGAIPFIKGE